jgi:CHASE3 domain sensor protein
LNPGKDLQPVNDKTIRRIIAFFFVVAAILVVVAINAVRNINRSAATADWVNHTHAVILEAQEMVSALHAGNAALRTYLLTGEARDQAAARESFNLMSEHLEILRPLTNAEAAARTEVTELARLVATRAETATDLATRRAAGIEPPATLLAADVGTETTAEIQRRVARLKEQQMGLLADRDTASYLQAQTTRWTVWAGVILDVMLLAGAVWLIRDDLDARRKAVAVLESANRDLDQKVKERTAELVASNDQLQVENLERQWANQALEHQRRYDQLIINSINDLVLVLTKVMNISRINPAVTQVTGFDGPDLINKPFATLVEFEPGKAAAAAGRVDPMAHALKTGREIRGPGSLRLKNGSRVPIRVTLCPLRDGDKVVGGVVILEVTSPAPA